MSTATRRVVVTCAYFEPGYKAGGPIPSVARIVRARRDNMSTVLFTNDRDLGDARPYPGLTGRTVTEGDLDVVYLDHRRPSHWWRAIRTTRGAPVDLLYLNSLWDPWFSIVPLILSVARIIPARRVLVAPRGELSLGAMSIKSRKKRLVKPVLRILLSLVHTSWHATAEMDAADIRREFGSDAHVIVLAEASPHEPTTSPINSRPGAARFVFVSRITPKKNLAAVLGALHRVEAPVSFEIYGPTEDRDYWQRCLRIVESLPAHVKVIYRGTLTPDQVQSTFEQYDAFVFPTLSENFGHVIAESLSVGCPVICSDQTPWTPLLATGGGEVLADIEEATIAEAVRRWCSLPPEELANRRRAARNAYIESLGQNVEQDIFELVLQDHGAE